MKPNLRSHTTAALLLLAALPASAANWPGFRGAEGNGISAEKNLPLKWSATAGVKWRIDLPERGNSSPIIWGDRVFLTQAVSTGNRRTLLCLDRATGQQLWQAGVAYDEREESHRDNPYCSATPVTDGERVIAYFGSAGLYCYDFTGKEVWHRELGKMTHMFGNAASPVLAGDLCVVNFGPDEKARIVAVNKRTGETAWEVAAPKPEPGEMPQRGPGGGPGDPAPRGPDDRFQRGPGDQTQSAPEGDRRSVDPGQVAGPQILAQADQNGDAKVSKEEFTALAQTWFDRVDKDQSGKLDRRMFGERFSELLAPPPVAAAPAGGDRPEGSRGAPDPRRALGFAFVSVSDADRDGSLTRDEWSGAFAKWFTEWDVDKAGALDEAKLRAGLNAALPRPQFGGGPTGPGGGRGPGGPGGFGGGRGGGSAGSWSTPVLIKSGDREELIVNFPSKIAALDPKTGQELWTAKGLGGASYTTPVVGGGALVATSSGPGGGAAVALKPGGSGDVTESQRLWKLDRFQSAVGSGVITGSHLYTVSQNGIAACTELKTGKILWEERLQGSGARGGSWSSLLLADGKIYAPNQAGDVFVLRAAPKFEVLATNSVGESTNASLAASDGALFLRTDQSLWCFADSAKK